jgi:hypothetical protein
MEKVNISAELLLLRTRRTFQAISDKPRDFKTLEVNHVSFYTEEHRWYMSVPVLHVEKCRASKEIGSGYRVSLVCGGNGPVFFRRFCLYSAGKPTTTSNPLFVITYLHDPKHGTKREITVNITGNDRKLDTTKLFSAFQRFYETVTVIEWPGLCSSMPKV